MLKLCNTLEWTIMEFNEHYTLVIKTPSPKSECVGYNFLLHGDEIEE